MDYTDRPTAGQQGSCAHDSRLITTIRKNDRATKNPTKVAGLVDVFTSVMIPKEKNK